MAEARQQESWNHTSALMALAVNMMRDPRKSKPARPEDFNPFTPKEPMPILKGKELRILKDVFVRNKKPTGE